jgi:hypothetical protein
MKTVCAVLFVLLLAVASFAQDHHHNVVHWKTIVGNITVSNNDAVAGINPGTTPWSTTGGRASVTLSTGHVSFEVEGLVLNGGNATGTRAGVDQVEGSLICDAGRQDQTIFTTLPVPLDTRGHSDRSRRRVQVQARPVRDARRAEYEQAKRTRLFHRVFAA